MKSNWKKFSQASSADDEDKKRTPFGSIFAFLSCCASVRRAMLRRSSADPERRRLSLGPAVGSAPAGSHRAISVDHSTLDPHHAAILFRDSRGGLEPSSVLPYVEKLKRSDYAFYVH
ncbi:hypothetical protein J437_LFUL005589 [Ladona fulva]|uniref:Uncharacterized protein n=1 Tax=Ladona fulva TaxID=123851 RepID=A0A8K0JX64_LADFU|nr:hypothetical protein J437_LFUL005589 [Ladona fulva]